MVDVQQERVNTHRVAHVGEPQRVAASYRAKPFATLLGLLALIAALRLAALSFNGTDLYVDEAQYWAWSRELAFGYFSKPPLIAWIIHGTTALCGDGEVCVRLPAVVLHLITAILVYGIGARLYSDDVALWSGLGYALLPAVSLSSSIISTDIPLLAAWAAALFAFAGLLTAPTPRDTVLLALALGLGLNAKYAMAYFILCAAIYFFIAPERRARLRQPHLWLALVGGLALIAPNILWNIANGFVTFAHTAGNAAWRGVPFNPGKAAEFLLSQFGVFGPILFGTLLAIVWRTLRSSADLKAPDKLLLAFSMPILALVTAQALISRAHVNWAAPTYIAAVILVTAIVLRDRAWRWLRASFALHIVLAVLFAAATWQAGRFTMIGIGDPLARTLGSRELAAAVREELAEAERKGQPVGSILTDARETAAALTYYARDIAVPVLSWRTDHTPRSYFEMARPFSPAAPSPVLLVSPRPTSSVTKHLSANAPTRARAISAGTHTTHTVHFTLLTRDQER